MRLAKFAAGLLLLVVARVGAQAVRGVVVDPGDRPVPGVVVLLIDAASREAARALSNELGEFRLTARAGDYRIRTLRIGFRPLISESIALQPGSDIVRRLVLSDVPVALDAIRTVSSNSCGMTAKDSAAATWAAWEQVQGALTATQLSGGNRGGIAATTVAYERSLDVNLKRVRSQTAEIRSDFVTQPWHSRAPDSLRLSGYVSTDSSGLTTYYAPGLDMLVSRIFLEDHCLRIAASPDSGRIGIAFEPTRQRRRLPEIRGAVWLDRKTSELRAMEFRYVNVSREQEAYAGGEMEFARLRNGEWAVSRWNIRMPAYAERFAGNYGSSGAGMGARESRLVEIRVTGGELALVTKPVGRNRDTLWSRPPLVLTGVVTDSVTGAPVPNARVTLGGALMEGTSDAAGRFAIPGTLPGRYVLEVRTPALDSVNAVNQSPVIFTDSAVAITIRVPTARLIAAAGAAFQGSVVADSSYIAIDDVEILLPELGMTTRANEQGKFRLSEIPPGTHQVVVRRIGYGALDTRIKFTANQVVERRVVLSKVVTLDSMLTVAPMRDIPMMEFEEHRRVALGRFHTRADLAKVEHFQLPTVLTQTAGVSIVRGSKGNSAFLTNLRPTRSGCGANALECLRKEKIYYVPNDDDQTRAIPIACYSRVYMDRTLMNPGEPTPPFDLSTVPIDRIEALEWYESTMRLPIQFMGRGPNCGVLVIHTRRYK